MNPGSSSPDTPRLPEVHVGPHPSLAEVTVDGHHWKVRKGHWVVRDFKSAVEVPPDYELDQIEHDELKPLADDNPIEIHGGEKFVSHVRQGGSS